MACSAYLSGLPRTRRLRARRRRRRFAVVRDMAHNSGRRLSAVSTLRVECRVCARTRPGRRQGGGNYSRGTRRTRSAAPGLRRRHRLPRRTPVRRCWRRISSSCAKVRCTHAVSAALLNGIPATRSFGWRATPHRVVERELPRKTCIWREMSLRYAAETRRSARSTANPSGRQARRQDPKDTDLFVDCSAKDPGQRRRLENSEVVRTSVVRMRDAERPELQPHKFACALTDLRNGPKGPLYTGLSSVGHPPCATRALNLTGRFTAQQTWYAVALHTHACRRRVRRRRQEEMAEMDHGEDGRITQANMRRRRKCSKS